MLELIATERIDCSFGQQRSGKLLKMLLGEQICGCFLYLSCSVSTSSMKKINQFPSGPHCITLSLWNQTDLLHCGNCEWLRNSSLCSELHGLLCDYYFLASKFTAWGLTLRMSGILRCSVLSYCVRDEVTTRPSCFCFMLKQYSG